MLRVYGGTQISGHTTTVSCSLTNVPSMTSVTSIIGAGLTRGDPAVSYVVANPLPGGPGLPPDTTLPQRNGTACYVVIVAAAAAAAAASIRGYHACAWTPLAQGLTCSSVCVCVCVCVSDHACMSVKSLSPTILTHYL